MSASVLGSRSKSETTSTKALTLLGVELIRIAFPFSSAVTRIGLVRSSEMGSPLLPTILSRRICSLTAAAMALPSGPPAGSIT